MQAFFELPRRQPVHPAVLHRRHGGRASASSRSRATAWAWSRRRSWSARRWRPGRRPTASSCSSTTSPSRSSTTCSCTAWACASGPSFFNSLKKDGITFTILAVICSFLGLFLVVLHVAKCVRPAGRRGGRHARRFADDVGGDRHRRRWRSNRAPTSCRRARPPKQVSGMIALGYGVTYIWGTVGIILICKYLPRWWGIDAKAAAEEVRSRARRQERRRRRPHRLSRRRPARLPARERDDRRQEHRAASARHIRSTGSSTSCAATRTLGAADDIVLQQGDVIALGGRLEELTSNLGLIGPEVPDAKVLNIPLDQAEILVTNKEADGKELKELRATKTSPDSIADHQHRARRRADPARPRNRAQALRRAVRRRPQGRDRQGRREARQDRAGRAPRPTC